MRYVLPILLVNLLAAPAAAQGVPNDGPPPDIRGQMEQARTNARDAVNQSLSTAHRAAVSAIVTSFENGNLSMCQAAEQIDGVLSPSESAPAIAQEQKMRETLPPPPPPGAAGLMPGGPHMIVMRSMRRHKPDAGEIVLMLSAMP